MSLPKPKSVNVERYIGGLSNINKINNPIKLSANESALGASPKAIKMFEKANIEDLKAGKSDLKRVINSDLLTLV